MASDTAAGTVSLTKRELDTVLAALRKWQRDYYSAGGSHSGRIGEWADFFQDEWPLTARQIDLLCERLDLAGRPRVLIEINRGMCNAVYADDSSTEVIVFDRDNIAEGETPPCDFDRTASRMARVL